MIVKSSPIIAALAMAACQPVPAAVVIARPVIVSRPVVVARPAPARVATPAPKSAPHAAELPRPTPFVPVVPARGSSAQTCPTNDKDCKR